MTTQVRVDYVLAQPDKYYIASGIGYHEVKGEPVSVPEYPEMDLFLYHYESHLDAGWAVLCGVTGTVFGTPHDDGRAYCPTKEEAISSARVQFRTTYASMDVLMGHRLSHIKWRKGPSPRYELAPWETGEEE